jgi:hypothetical protein
VWVFSLPLRGQTSSIAGAWLQNDVKWKKPPAELRLKERYAESAILFFGVNDEFAMVYGTVIRGADSEELSHGDGRVAYLGTWKSDEGRLRATYRLVSRTVHVVNEKLPGPTETREIQRAQKSLVFGGMRFHREVGLDQSIRATFEGEHARASE